MTMLQTRTGLEWSREVDTERESESELGCKVGHDEDGSSSVVIVGRLTFVRLKLVDFGGE